MMKNINHIMLSFVLVAAFSINSAALVNAGPKIKDSKIITKTSKPAKSLPTKKKSPRTLQRNNP
ncbi:MAG: hypothetical protein GY707_07065, partial [Desulfobacteraceae bacterium]|nr:hypothetical protein [Desulfobacteraceae bacterium]